MKEKIKIGLVVLFIGFSIWKIFVKTDIVNNNQPDYRGSTIEKVVNNYITQIDPRIRPFISAGTSASFELEEPRLEIKIGILF